MTWSGKSCSDRLRTKDSTAYTKHFRILNVHNKILLKMTDYYKTKVTIYIEKTK